MKMNRELKLGSGGYFYKVKFDDAIILHFLLNYKIVDYQTVIFPTSALDKVKRTLKKYSINFEVARETVYRFIPNNYETIKLKAYESLDKELRINNIVKKINSLPGDKLNNLLTYLENYEYEK